MQNKLEKYIHANREAFDSEEPGAHVWQNFEAAFVKKQGGLEAFVQANREAFDDEQPGANVWAAIEDKFVPHQDGRLEQFVQANRQAFDDEQPGAAVWQKLEETFVPKQEQKTPAIFRSMVAKVISIAAILILVAVSVWQFAAKDNTTTTQPLAQNEKPKTSAPAEQLPKPVTLPAEEDKTSAPSAQDKIADVKTPAKDNATQEVTPASDDDQTQEIFYYTKLTEIKFKELKKIEKEEPALYHSFAAEIKKLDDNYHGLQAMLKGNADKEAILSAMITNLKMQTEILSKQLYIIHSLKKSKQTKNEPTDKSI